MDDFALLLEALFLVFQGSAFLLEHLHVDRVLRQWPAAPQDMIPASEPSEFVETAAIEQNEAEHCLVVVQISTLARMAKVDSERLVASQRLTAREAHRGELGEE